jgi:hypothetical protein
MAVLGTVEPAAPTMTEQADINFNRDVKPILSEHCFPCHGPDKEATAKTGGYRLDSFEEATRDLGDYFGIKPGSLDDSYLVERIDAEVPELRMPPPNSIVKPLTKEQRETLKTWILQGAEYDKHWAYQTPVQQPPPVSDSDWIKNPIDQFILSKLEDEGVKPAQNADKGILARRATLALTGLPPTLEELASFESDQSEMAYENLVDRLLADDSYGEHQARYWLDAVRYADTQGFHHDHERSVWPYRDWVVRALNQDLPFDQFAVWQLAGDLLPAPTLDQKIASGYIRIHATTDEGGALEEEYRTRYAFDRTETTGTAFLGITINCARCHDHRYDPISQEEYYGMYAFFNSTTENPLAKTGRDPVGPAAPTVRAPSPRQQEQMAALTAEKQRLEDSVSEDQVRSWTEAAQVIPVVVSGWEKSQTFAATNFDQAFSTDYGPESAAAEVKWTPIKIILGEQIDGVVGKENAAVYLRAQFKSSQAQRIEISLGSDDAIRAWANGKLIHDNKILRGVASEKDEVAVDLKRGRNELIFKVVNAGTADGFYISMGDKQREAIQEAILLMGKQDKTKEDLRNAAALYLEFGEESDAWRTTVEQIADLNASIPQTLIAQDTDEPREAFLLHRGEYDQPRQQVERSIPGALGELPEGAPKNRLGFAQWVTDPANPLTARVFVNRIWQQHFGTGLVKTSEDFGSQGEWPSHPELLDWLSREFVDSGWSVKHLHRLILTSAAYQQSAKASPESLAKDPLNRLISRGPRFRMDAEVIRDQALFISGLMTDKHGGKGVKPYQPGGLWEAISEGLSNTKFYVQDHGEALYRRSLYSFWKRTQPPAMLQTFDAPTREACVVRRSRTNTPLQALATMNDPQFVEASRRFAERVMSGAEGNARRAELAFEMATLRLPDRSERDILLKVFRRERLKFLADPEAAVGLLSVGESERNETLSQADHAAWTLVCSMIFNLDEVLTLH